jgi:hypothetical protein
VSGNANRVKAIILHRIQIWKTAMAVRQAAIRAILPRLHHAGMQPDALSDMPGQSEANPAGVSESADLMDLMDWWEGYRTASHQPNESHDIDIGG